MDLTIAMTGAAPALGLMWYFDRLDAKRPEPRWTLRKVAIAGAIMTIPCAGIESGLLHVQVSSFPALWMIPLFIGLVAGLTEELGKLVCLAGLAWSRPEFDERMDGIVYATRAGLGFALVENVLYLHDQKTAGGFAVVFLIRALFAVPGHAIWAGIMGYFAARRRFDKRGPGMLGGLAIAVVLHALYDASILGAGLLMADGQQGLGIALLALPIANVVIGGLVLRGMARRAVAADDAEAAQKAAAAPLAPPAPAAAAV